MPKHFFFDLDNTLTRSRSHINSAHTPILQKLAVVADIIIVSGAVRAQQAAQLEPEITGKYFSLGQNGNTAYAPDGTLLWEQKLTDTQKVAVFALITKMRTHLNLAVRDENDLVEDRGSQISYSLIGHHEDVATKEACDPDHSKRIALVKTFAADVEKLATEHHLEMRSGGTTCLDIFEKGKNKGYNCAQLIEQRGWKKEDCIYIGDALFPGGNDETVIGVIPTKSVANPDETFEYLAHIVHHG